MYIFFARNLKNKPESSARNMTRIANFTTVILSF